jgi:RND superfamily putative drug exporter
MFEALGPFIYKHRWGTLAASASFLLVALCFLLRGGNLISAQIHGLEAERAEERIKQVVGHPLDTTFFAIFHSADLDPESDDFANAMDAALAPVVADPHTLSVATPKNPPPFLVDALTNDDAHEAVAMITLKGSSQRALDDYPEARARLRSDKLQITATGEIPFANDLNHTLDSDLARAELISLPLAVLVLMLVFRTVAASVLPVGVGALAVAGGLASVLALSHVTEIALYTLNVCSLVGLGVAIDYSLFTVSRYREELDAGHDYPEALNRALSHAGRVVAFSGAAVFTGLSGLLFFEGSYLSAMGIGGAVVVAFSVVFALTFLPALLAVMGPRIHAGRLPGRASINISSGSWARMASWVMRRPVMVLVPTLVFLLSMGIPFLRLKMARADVRVLTQVVEARQGYSILKADFPELAQTRLVVAVEFPQGPALTFDRVGALFDLSRRIAGLPHVRKVESIVDGPQKEMSRAAYQYLLTEPPPPAYAAQLEQARKISVGERAVLLSVLTEGDPDSEEAREVVRGIRSERKVGDGDLLVGGDTAYDLDTISFVRARVPRAVAFVVAVTLVMLFLFLGSVLLPIKAVLMNFVSLAGSLGALVWVFQEGHGFIHEPRPIEPSLPVLLFCCLFGLSMDYEVLMLSRMKEAFVRTGDNTASVAEGLEKSAGLITSAALIMVIVFGAFSLARVILVRALGFGMAVAVAVDATLVRVLLVPATMRLLGDLNWWAPAPLVRLRRALHLEQPAGSPDSRADKRRS